MNCEAALTEGSNLEDLPASTRLHPRAREECHGIRASIGEETLFLTTVALVALWDKDGMVGAFVGQDDVLLPLVHIMCKNW